MTKGAADADVASWLQYADGRDRQSCSLGHLSEASWQICAACHRWPWVERRTAQRPDPFLLAI